MNKRPIGAIIQQKLFRVFVFWPKATLATLVLRSCGWRPRGGDRSFSGSDKHPEGREEMLLEGTQRMWLRKKERGWHWFVPKSDASPSEATLCSSGDSQDWPVNPHSWYGCGLGRETLSQEQRPELAVGETPTCVCDRDQRRHESYSPAATMQPQVRAGGDLGKTPCTCGHRQCNYWDCGRQKGCGEWQW